MLGPGQQTPEVRARDQHGRAVSLGELLSAGPTVLCFCGPASAPEMLWLRDAYAELRQLGARVAGVSHGAGAGHRGLAEAHAMPFPVLEDADARIAEAFGVRRRLRRAPRRLTFVIDPDGRVVDVLECGRDADQHVDRVQDCLRRLLSEGERTPVA